MYPTTCNNSGVGQVSRPKVCVEGKISVLQSYKTYITNGSFQQYTGILVLHYRVLGA